MCGLAAARCCADDLVMKQRQRSQSPPPRRERPRNDSPAAIRRLHVAKFASPWVRARSVGQHPFVYARMISDADDAAQVGDIVTVYDKTDYPVGQALFNPHSQIVLRMLSRTPTPLDDAFWQDALRKAVSLRASLRIDEATDAYRLVHAEGDGLSGVVIERYADHIVMEHFSRGMYERRDLLAKQLREVVGPPASANNAANDSREWTFVSRMDAQVAKWEGMQPTEVAASEKEPRIVEIREHGVRYRVDVATGHKTGFFCDQRDNRKQFATLCRDADVLDLCCYTGGFGICAKTLGGAAQVTAVDLDEDAIAIAKENANLNQARIKFAHADAFIYLRQIIENQRQFDAVVLDPPKFARSRDGKIDALIKYNDLNMLALQVVKPGGFLLTCSCSGLVNVEEFTEAVRRGAQRAERKIQIIDRSGAAADHPIALNCPESEYLKALWLRVE